MLDSKMLNLFFFTHTHALIYSNSYIKFLRYIGLIEWHTFNFECDLPCRKGQNVTGGTRKVFNNIRGRSPFFVQLQTR